MAENFVSLYKTRKKGDTSILKLKCSWLNGELNILVIDGKTAWSGKFRAEEIKKFCEVLGITRDEYITECQQAFSGGEAVEKFSFTVEDNRFVWRKELDAEIRVKFGSILLFSIPLVQALEEFVDFAFESVEHCRQEVATAKNKTAYFETERTSLLQRIEEYAQNKEEIENILYGRFLCVLNSKKERIGILEGELSDLKSKFQHSVTETEHNKCDETVATEQKFKAKPSPKATREMRNTNKKPYQRKVRQPPPSKAVDTESQMLSDSPFENNDTRTTRYGTSRGLKHKQNVRQKGGQRAIINTFAENVPTSYEKEESDPSTSKVFVQQVSCDVLEQSGSTQHKPSMNDTVQLKTLIGRSASPIASTSTAVPPLENHIPVKYASADQFTPDEPGTCWQSQADQRSASLVKRDENDLLSEPIKDVGSLHSLGAKDKIARELSEVICPIDLVSQENDAQSVPAKYSVNKITITENNKKVVSSPAKQYKEFEIISPLDLLVQPKSLTSSIPKNTVHTSENTSLNRPMRSVNIQDDNSFESSTGGTNICQEADTASVHEDDVNDINTNTRINAADVTFVTIPSTNQMKSQTEVEGNHYDSDTDVDEPEDVCKLSAKHRSFSGSMEESNHSPIAVSENQQVKCEEIHQVEQKNAIENLLNDSQDADNNSVEIPMAALPKRTRRSGRVNKHVPVINKSINHFTSLGRLQGKTQNVSQNVRSTLYEQETQIVDTQKLLDQLG